MIVFSALTPNGEILSELGRRLKKLRKQRGLNQDQLAEAAGLGVATLRRIEDGQDSQLGSWIKLMKALDMLHAIDALLPENLNSPMAEAARLGKAIKRHKPPAGATSNEPGEAIMGERDGKAPATGIWGEERE